MSQLSCTRVGVCRRCGVLSPLGRHFAGPRRKTPTPRPSAGAPLYNRPLTTRHRLHGAGARPDRLVEHHSRATDVGQRPRVYARVDQPPRRTEELCDAGVDGYLVVQHGEFADKPVGQLALHQTNAAQGSITAEIVRDLLSDCALRVGLGRWLVEHQGAAFLATVSPKHRKAVFRLGWLADHCYSPTGASKSHRTRAM